MKKFNEMNVIPLIDVMLVLLAIVLMTASFIVKDNLKIDLPETESTQAYQPEKNDKPIKFSINANNQFFQEEAPTNLVNIEAFLPNLEKNRPILLQVDQAADFGRFVQLVDALKKQKLQNLTILTEAK